MTLSWLGIRRSTRVRQPPTKFTEEEEGEDEEAMYVKVDSGTKKARKSVDKGTTSADAVAVDDDEDDEVKVVGEGSTPTTSATKPKKASKSSEGKGGVHFFATPVSFKFESATV